MGAWRRLAIACGLVVAPAVACVLDIPDVTSGDASADAKAADAASDAVVPPACATLDASCVPTIPEGWKPVVVVAAGKSCDTDFSTALYVSTPQLVANACACSACSTTGTHSCDAGVTFTTNTASCISSGSISPNQCTAAGVNGYLQYDNYGAVGNVTCTPGAPSNANATATPITACYPTSCSSDYCGASGLKCIEQVGVAGCPSGFTQQTIAGDSASAQCAACGCTVKSAVCSGSLACWNGDPFCGGAPGATIATGNVCTNVGGTCGVTTYIKFTPALPPAPSCVQTQDASVAVLAGERTICCVP